MKSITWFGCLLIGMLASLGFLPAQTSYRFQHFWDWYVPSPKGFRGGSFSSAAIIGDFDRDSVPDILLGSRGLSSVFLGSNPPTYVHFLFFKGSLGGKFYVDPNKKIPINNIKKEKTWAYSMASGDFDGDGDRDLYIGRSKWVPNQPSDNPLPDLLFLNDGKGNFSYAPKTALPPNNFITADSKAIDIDGDGDLDILTAVDQGLNRIYINDGKGNFKDESTKRYPKNLTGFDTGKIVPGDVDGDGDIDLFWATGGWLSFFSKQNDLLLLNDGKGFFKLSAQPDFKVRNTGSGAFADFDGDGDLDLVTASQAEPSRLYLNTGKGKFSDVTSKQFPNPKEEHYWVLAIDVDGDGDKDILSGGRCPFRVFLNNGKGFFKEVPAAPDASTRGGSYEMVAGDLDQDGDLDLVQLDHTIFTSDLKLYYNLQRQLYIPAKRFAPGQATTIEIDGLGGAQLSVVFVSTKPGRFPLPPLGTWYLDPLSSIPFLRAALVGSGGKASTTYKLPLDWNLVGLTAYCQGILFDIKSKKLRFTNRTENKIKYPWEK